MIPRSAFLKSREIFVKARYLSFLHGGDKILPATNTVCWDSHDPVKIRMEDTAPGNYPPILVQTMVRNAVKKFGPLTALVSHDGKTRWTYDDYLDQIQNVAKGFIDIGLQPSHAVGIMANNCPQWFTSRYSSFEKQPNTLDPDTHVLFNFVYSSALVPYSLEASAQEFT